MGTNPKAMTEQPNTAETDGRRRSLSEGFAEFARPNNGKDWSRLMLTIVLGVAMLLAGRVWGESELKNTTERALTNAGRVDAIESRFNDHVQAQAEANRNILSELRDIRRLLQERQDEDD